ncbi:MAG: hypothetical protein ACTHOM_16370 [Allomuricauda sp.]
MRKTQEQLAEIAQVGINTLYKIEKGMPIQPCPPWKKL